MLASSVQHLWVPGPLPTLNDLIEARTHHGRTVNGSGKRWNEYSAIKRMLGERVAFCARAQHIKPVPFAYFTYLVFEKNRRRDPFNVVAVAVKIVEDGLQSAGILANDGWKQVLGVSCYWEVDAEKPGVAVFLSKHAPLDRATALYNDQLQRR